MKKLRLNIVFPFLLQLITIVCNFIVPRQILLAFGSDVNGLISSLTQFLNYISLIEGGIASVIMTNLYKPLMNKDDIVLSRTIIAANYFFRKIARIFIVYLVLLALIYPLFVEAIFSYSYIFTLTLILGVSLSIQYYFSITWRLLLQSDEKVYISSVIQILSIILNTILTIVAIKFYANIHFVKILASLGFVIQPFCYDYFVRKYYRLDLKLEGGISLLKQRWNAFGINLAAFFNANIDIFVLTFFTTLKDISIYSIYGLVAMGIKSIITSFSAGIVPTLGKYYVANDKKKLLDFFNKYEVLIFYLTFSIYTSAMILIVPFVLNYTTGVSDADYSRSVLSILLLSSFMVFCLREPYVNMAYVANSYKYISKYAYVEILINIVLSLLFVYRFGLNGVALGTLMSMLYRTLVQVVYLKYNILNRSISMFIYGIFCFGLTSFMSYCFCKVNIAYPELGWYSWLVYAVLISLSVFMFNLFALILINVRNKRYA